MICSWRTTFSIGCLSIVLGCARLSAFPSEDEMSGRLRQGMTINEVIAAFGRPSTGVPQLPGVSHVRYIAPIGSMTVPKEGYMGFEIELLDGRVRSWRTFRGNPSYAAMTGPPGSDWPRWAVRLFVAGAGAYGMFLAFKRRQTEKRSILEAYKLRDIPRSDLPVEFR